MLKVKNLDVAYGSNKAVDDFNMEIGQGEIVSIVGESGSGKSTVIRTILGLLPSGGKVTEGSIVYNGRDILGLDAEAFTRFRGKEVAMIFQDSGAMLNPIRRIGSQFIEYILQHTGLTEEEASREAVNMLDRMQLPNPEEIMKRYPFQLSGGQRQRVGIAMAMALSPKLLLADEPTSALDVTTQAQIVEQMAELRDQFDTSIIMVTHNLGVAAYMSDKIIVMKDGKIVECGTTQEVIDHPKEAYTRELLKAVPVLDGGLYAKQ
ncbi:MAG: ABC transporter ATP-binding protein [Eubacteriaceae bacterium]|jgi:peptide/nickel transport system ATP-binding protein